MSYCYDLMRGVYMKHIHPILVREGMERLSLHFEMLIEDMHSANHKVPSADGVFKGDGINKDPAVSRAARELDEYVKEFERIKAGERKSGGASA